MKNVFVLGLCYGTDHVEGMLKIANAFCHRNFPKAKVTEIIIDNKNIIGESQYFDHRIQIPGDNSCHEFSGWQVGLEFIKENSFASDRDVILLINDTIHRRNYTLGGDDFHKDYAINDTSMALPEKWAAGFIDDFPREVSIGGLNIASWIRSNFVAFTYNCTSTVSPLVFPVRESLLFGERGSTSFWNSTAPLSENWKAYISSWLFGKENPEFPEYNLKWLKSSPLTLENWESSKRKALCIMSEHFLTARLQNAGVKIFDFNNHPKSPERHTTPYYN